MSMITRIADRLIDKAVPRAQASALSGSCSNLGYCYQVGNQECCCVGLPGGPGWYCTNK